MKKFGLGIILILFLVNFVSASVSVQSLGTLKKGECIDLPQTCGNCSYVNISSIQINNDLINMNVEMTQNGVTYNYTYCDTQTLGKYIINTEGDGVPSPYEFKVTTTGRDGGNALPLFMWLGGFAVLALGLWQKNEYFGFFSAAIFIVAGIYMMIYGLGDVWDTYTRALSFVSLGLGLILGFLSTIEMFYHPLSENE